jgi:hypothetical protein
MDLGKNIDVQVIGHMEKYTHGKNYKTHQTKKLYALNKSYKLKE